MYSHIQNGSDIRGVAIETKEDAITLSKAVVEAICVGFSKWLRSKANNKANLRVSIGRDSRLSGPELMKWTSACLNDVCGIDTAQFGLASTPAMFMSTVTEGHMYDAAIMITASHLPYHRNGFKFFLPSGGLAKKDIKDILAGAEAYTKDRSSHQVPATKGSSSKVDFMRVYTAQLVAAVRKGTDTEQPLAGFHIIVDAGNGAGGFFVDRVLQPLGASTQGSLFLDPDGMFPNHIPNPENEAAMDSIKKQVVATKADLGIVFDTDVDRSAVVFSSGKAINRNRFIALCATIVLEKHPNSTIVTDSVTSSGLAEFLQGLNGHHHRFKRGYKNVISEGIRLLDLHRQDPTQPECHFAAETSGHCALSWNYWLDDGAYLIVELLIKMANLRKEGNDKPQTLVDLIAELREPVESDEFRLKIHSTQDHVPVGNAIIDALHEEADQKDNSNSWSLPPTNFEGVRVVAPNGWFLVRMSLHDPLVVINVESDVEGGNNRTLTALCAFLKTLELFVKHVDGSKLQEYL